MAGNKEKKLSAAVDMNTIKVDDKHAYVPLSELVDGKTVFFYDGKLTTIAKQYPYYWMFYCNADNSCNFYGYENASDLPAIGDTYDGKTIDMGFKLVEVTSHGSSGATYTNYEPHWLDDSADDDPLYWADTAAAYEAERVFVDPSFKTVALPDVYRFFNSFINLENLDFCEGWNTSRATGMASAFDWCSSLIDASGIKDWDTSSAQDMERMFCGCQQITELDFSNWDTRNVESAAQFLAETPNLQRLTIGANFDLFTKFNTTQIRTDEILGDHEIWYNEATGTLAPDYLAGVSVDETTTFTTYDPTE